MSSLKTVASPVALATLALSLSFGGIAAAQPYGEPPPAEPPPGDAPPPPGDAPPAGEQPPGEEDPDKPLPPLVPPKAGPPPAGPPPGAPPGYGQRPDYGPPGGHPPPGYGPPGYGPPAGGYYAPYGYPYPPPAYPYGVPQLPPPRTLPYHEGEEAPDGYHLDTRMQKGLVIAGAVTFGASYMLTAAVALAFQDESDAEDFAPLFAPVAGPFIALGTADPTALGTFALIADGLAQSAGVAMFISGLASKEKIWVRNPVARVRVTPMIAGRHFTGLGLVGEM